MLNGAGDPGRVLEFVPFVDGKGTPLDVGCGKGVLPELAEPSVACVALWLDPIGRVAFPRGVGLDVGAGFGVEETPVPV
jgi:hypothetical protein